MAFNLTVQWPGELRALQNSNTTTQENKPIYFAVIVIIITAYERRGQEGTTATVPTSERGIVGQLQAWTV